MALPETGQRCFNTDLSKGLICSNTQLEYLSTYWDFQVRAQSGNGSLEMLHSMQTLTIELY